MGTILTQPLFIGTSKKQEMALVTLTITYLEKCQIS